MDKKASQQLEGERRRRGWGWGKHSTLISNAVYLKKKTKNPDTKMKKMSQILKCQIWLVGTWVSVNCWLHLHLNIFHSKDVLKMKKNPPPLALQWELPRPRRSPPCTAANLLAISCNSEKATPTVNQNLPPWSFYCRLSYSLPNTERPNT